jgi:hypothetical protein
MRDECAAGTRRVGKQVAQHHLKGRVVITVKLAAGPDGSRHQARRQRRWRRNSSNCSKSSNGLSAKNGRFRAAGDGGAGRCKSR